MLVLIQITITEAKKIMKYRKKCTETCDNNKWKKALYKNVCI